MGRLNILPDVYYDLTGPETTALLAGMDNRDIFTLRQTRILGTLLHNSTYTKPITEREFMPLPGDEEAWRKAISNSDPEAMFDLLDSVFPGETTIEYH